MGLSKAARTGAIVIAAAASVLAAPNAIAAPAATLGGWTATVLPLPTGDEDARGYLSGTDSHGGYSGAFGIGGTSQVVTWSGGQPTLRGIPKGFTFAMTADENSSGLIVGDALDDKGGSRAFVLQGSTFTLLPQPSGFESENVRAVNEDGDVLGMLFDQDDPSKDVAVVWSHLVVNPRLIPLTHDGQNAIDLDDDGTILFDSFDGALLWRDGTLAALPHPSGYTYSNPGAIRNGVVVGDASSQSVPNGQAFRWPTAPDSSLIPAPLPDGTFAQAINASGLTVGVDDHYLPLAWQGTTPAGSLPIPSGYTNASAGTVGDDGAVLGVASDGPLDEGGAPVVWHQN